MPESEVQGLAAEGAGGDPTPRASWGMVLCLGAAFLCLAWSPVAALSRAWLSDGNYSHGFVVPLLSLYLAWRSRERLAAGPLRPDARGILAVGAGAFIIFFSRWYEVSLLPGGYDATFAAGLGLIVVIAGMVWTLLGYGAMTKLAYPIGFLLFALPVPMSVISTVTLPLKRVVSILSVVILNALQIDALRQGNVIHIGQESLGVADACSGIRSLWVLTTCAAAIGFLRRIHQERAIMLLLAVVPATFVGNITRVVLTGIFTAMGHYELSEGAPHEFLGMLTFVLSLGCVALAAHLLDAEEQIGDPETDGGQEPVATPAAGILSRPLAVAAVSSVLVLGAVSVLYVEHHYDRLFFRQVARLSARRPLSELPQTIGPYRQIRESALTPEEFSMLEPVDHTTRIYLGPNGSRIILTAMYWDPIEGKPSEYKSFKKPHSPDDCYPSAGWRRLRDLDENAVFPWVKGETVSIRVFERNDQRQVLVFWLGELFTRRLHLEEFVDRIEGMVRTWDHPAAADIHNVTIAVAETTSVESARATALDFAEELAPLLPEFGIGRTR